MQIGVVKLSVRTLLSLPLLFTLAACGHSQVKVEDVSISLDVEMPLDIRAEDVLPGAWQLYEEGKVFSAEAQLQAYLKINPNHLEASTLLAYMQEETGDVGEAGSAWADVEALLVYQGKLAPYQLQPSLFAGARHYLRLQKPQRARLFHDELWRRFPASSWSQLAQLEVVEAAVARGRWGNVSRTCSDMMRLGANSTCRARCGYLLKVAARMLTMGPEPSNGAPRWRWLHPAPQGNTLHDVWVGQEGDLFAVGVGGTILHRPSGTGAPFSLIPSGTRWNLRAIHGTRRDRLYAVGDAGIVLTFDGKAWRTLRPADPINADLSGVYSPAKGQVVAVSLSGEILHFSDGKWTEHQPTNQPLFGIWGDGKGRLYAVGKGGLMLKHQDGKWDTTKSDSYEDLWGIWGNGDGSMVAVGSNRTVVALASDGKSKEAVAGLSGFRDVWGLADGRSWAVGTRGNIIHQAKAGAPWANQRTGISVDLLGVAGSDDKDLVVVGQGGTLLTRGKRGYWVRTAGGSVERLVAVVPDLGSGQEGIMALGEKGSLLLHGDKGWKRYNLLPRGRYRALCTTRGRFGAVGDRGLFMLYENKKWRRIKSGTSEDLMALDGCGDGGLVAVGTRGTVVRYKDGKARVERTPTGHTLYGVWVGSPKNIWAVGARGVTVHFDGKRWSELDSGQINDLRAVAMAGKQLMAVGQGGIVLNLEGNRWKSFESPTAQTLVALWGGPRGRLVAASWQGGIVHHDGEKWVVHASPAPCLSALVHHPNLGLLAAGCNQSIIRLPLEDLK